MKTDIHLHLVLECIQVQVEALDHTNHSAAPSTGIFLIHESCLSVSTILIKDFLHSSYPPLALRVMGKRKGFPDSEHKWLVLSRYWKLGWRCCHLTKVWDRLDVAQRWHSVNSQGMSLAWFLNGFMNMRTAAILEIKLTNQKERSFGLPDYIKEVATILNFSFGFWSITHSSAAGCPDLFNMWVFFFTKNMSLPR